MSAMLVSNLTAQGPVPVRAAPPLPTADEIVAALGGESDAVDVVQQALRFLAEEYRWPEPTVPVLDAQLHTAWIPSLPSLEFQRLSNDEAVGDCRRLGVVQSVTRVDDEITVDIGETRTCDWAIRHLTFHRVAGMWRRDSGGEWTAGGGSAPCRCG
jgi:hypothetical protein